MKLLISKEIKELKQKLDTKYIDIKVRSIEQLPNLRMQYLIDDYQDFVTNK